MKTEEEMEAIRDNYLASVEPPVGCIREFWIFGFGFRRKSKLPPEEAWRLGFKTALKQISEQAGSLLEKKDAEIKQLRDHLTSLN